MLFTQPNRCRNKGHSGLCNRAALLVLVCTMLGLGIPDTAIALVPDYQPTSSTYILYTFCGCGLLFLAIITLILRIYRWLHYVALASAQVLTQAAVSGALPYWLGGSDFVLYVIPYLVISFGTSLGYYVAGSQLEAPHPFTRYRNACYITAAICAIGPLTSYFWLMKIPLNLMWVPQLVLFYSMYAVLILPAWTWRTETRAQTIMTRSFPLVTGLPFILLPFFEEPGYELIGAVAKKIELFGIGATFFYVWLLAIWLGISGQAARQTAERKALEASMKEAELQLALRDAERDYKKARLVAHRSKQTLASVSHDLKQPIASLRMAVEQLEAESQQTESGALSRAVDYVEGLAKTYVDGDEPLDEDLPNLDPEAIDIAHTNAEPISAQVLIDSLQQMLGAQAERQQVRLTLEASDAVLLVPPLDAMRVLSNLLSNALQHANAQNLSLKIRPADNRAKVVISDDGMGMTPEQIKEMQLSGNKSEESVGDGLGLTIATNLCTTHLWSLQIDSAPGQGTQAQLSFPLAEPNAT